MKLVVTNNQDSGEGSLRWAVEHAKNGSVIPISSKVSAIELKSEIRIHCHLTIRGKKTIIRAISSRHFRVRESASCTLRGLILTNGTSTFGGSILSECAKSEIVLEDVRIEKNVSVFGGGVFTLGTLTLIRSVVDSNVALKQGGGIWCAQDLTMIESSVSSNKISGISRKNFGGGIVVDSGTVFIHSSSVRSNTVGFSSRGGSSGGIHQMTGSLILENSRVDENSAYSAGGIQMGIGSITVLTSSISKNRSFIQGSNCGGGGIVISKGNVHVEDSEISFNCTEGMYSGGIVSFLGNISVIRSQMEGNRNRGPGGAIAANFRSRVSVISSKISANQGASLGGGIVNFSGPDGSIEVSNSEFVENVLTNAQTLGQTVEAFLEVLSNHVDGMVRSASGSANPGAERVQNELPQLLELGSQTAELFSKLELDSKTVGGGAIATLLGCPVFLHRSKFIRQKIEQVEKTKFIGIGNGLFLPHSSSLIEKSLFENNKEAIWNGGTLRIGDGVFKDNSVINNGTLICISTKIPDLINNGTFISLGNSS